MTTGTENAAPRPASPQPDANRPDARRPEGAAGDAALKRLEEQEREALNWGARLSTAAALLWIPQAALLAFALAHLTSESGGAGAFDAAVWGPCLGLLGLAAAARALDAYGQWLARSAARRVVTRARRALAERLSLASPFDRTAPPSGVSAALGAEKLELLAPYLTRYPAARLRTVIAPLALVVAVAAVSWAAALVLLVAGPLIPLFMALVGMAAREASEKQMAELGTLNGALLERLRGLTDIRLLNAAASIGAEFDRAAEGLRAKTMEVLRIAFLSSAVLELFSALGVAMLAVYVGFSLLGVLEFGAWGNGLTLAEGVFVLLLAPEFFQPLRDFAAAWHDRAGAQAVARELEEATERPPSAANLILGRGAPCVSLPGPAEIRLTDLGARGFFLPGATRIAPGERVAVTGPSGAGKSTFLALLAGLASAERGVIEVAGQRLDQSLADAWRARLSWVGQSPHFFSGSIRSAVAMGGDATDRGAIAAALETAAATPFVAAAPRGLDQRIGEHGSGVSGGEGRRLAIARAAYRGADVVLADEPTAHLDHDTAEAVTKGLLRLSQNGASLIVATHDPILIERLERRIDLTAAKGAK